jgi:hypothetical protein
MEMFRSLWGSWPEWEGRLDSGHIVFIRIRHGQVWIGKAETGEAALETESMSFLTRGILRVKAATWKRIEI